MPLQNVQPGDGPPPASDWNASMRVARAYAAGELTGPAAALLAGGDSRNIVTAKNVSGEDLPRFAVVDLDEAVFSAGDNEGAYKDGPALKITGPPVGGRLAFCGIVLSPVAAGKVARVAVAGWVVAKVRGDGQYAWPTADDLVALETRNSGGFPVYDRGEADEDGISLATILLTPTTNEGSGTSLPSGLSSSDCQCGKSVRGRAVGDCEDCSCINPLRRTALPVVQSLDYDPWPEVQTIIELTYAGNCEHKSRIIKGITCIVGEEDEEVSDEYQFVVNYHTGIAELKCITELPQCPVIYIRWVFCPNCAKQCTSTWRLKLDVYENCFVENCEICITPLKDRKQTEIPCNECTDAGFVLPGEVQVRIADHPVPSTKMCGVEIDPENPEGPGIPGHTIPASYDQCHFNGKHLCKDPPNLEMLWGPTDYTGSGLATSLAATLQGWRDASSTIMCDVIWSKQFIRYVCTVDPPCPPVEGGLPNVIVHWVVAWLDKEGDAYRIKGYLKAGETSSELCAFYRDSLYQSERTYTCEELTEMQNFDEETEDAPEVELVFVSGADGITDSIDPLPSLWFSFQIPEDDPAPSSGHFGADCGPPEEIPCQKPCKVVVVSVSVDGETVHGYAIKRKKGCGSALCSCDGMREFYCGGPVLTLPGLGPAADHPIGWVGTVACVGVSAPPGEGITVTLSPGAGCGCGPNSYRICSNGSDIGTTHSKTIGFCGGTFNLYYSYDPGTDTWSLTFDETGGGASSFDTKSSPTGPFNLNLSAFGIAGTCLSLIATVST